MIEEPVISPNLTVEDIHKIREYHYELPKDMTKNIDVQKIVLVFRGV